MREIKFRAWDKQDDRIVYMDGTDYGEDEYIWQVDLDAIRCHRIEWCQNTLGGEVNDTYEVNRHDILPLMQYTGLKDKNGVDVYESDIVKGGKHIGIIEYQAVGWNIGFIIKQISKSNGVCDGFYYPDGMNIGFDEIEVIGNIYQHKYLLDNN